MERGIHVDSRASSRDEAATPHAREDGPDPDARGSRRASSLAPRNIARGLSRRRRAPAGPTARHYPAAIPNADALNC